MLISCQVKDEDIKTININPLEAKGQVNLSELVDSIKYIKLQTTPDCILGKISMLTIGEKYIYAVESLQGAVFIFDKHGSLVAKLDKYGNGPEEYNDFTGIFIDPNEQYIEITDHKKLLKYAVPDFDVLEIRKMENIIYGPSMRKNAGAYYYSTMQVDNLVNGEMTNADVIIKKDGNVKPLFDKKTNLNGDYFMPFTESFTINNKNELYVTLKFNNTFYQLKNMQASPAFRVDFGNYGLDNSMIWRRPGNKQIEILNNSKNLASFPVLNINNTNILAFSYSYRNNNGKTLNHYYFKLNKSNKVIHTKSIVNDLSAFPKYIYISNNEGGVNHESWHNQYLVSIAWPHEIINTDTEYFEEIGTLSSEDNPVIILMKLKDQ